MRMIQYGDDTLDSLVRSFGTEYRNATLRESQSRVHALNVELSEEERLVRTVAKKLDLDMPTAERIHKLFCEFDTDGSGLIEFDEFENMVARMLRTSVSEIPEARMLRFWQEIDSDGSGEVDFEEFASYYVKYFGGDGHDPARALYSQLGVDRLGERSTERRTSWISQTRPGATVKHQGVYVE
jgi:Ca2+-binding EF-hand superfamily protein